MRLENEHVGNADQVRPSSSPSRSVTFMLTSLAFVQFRVTREVPLPYRFQNVDDDDDDDDEDGESRERRRRRLRDHKTVIRLSGLQTVPDDEEAGHDT